MTHLILLSILLRLVLSFLTNNTSYCYSSTSLHMHLGGASFPHAGRHRDPGRLRRQRLAGRVSARLRLGNIHHRALQVGDYAVFSVFVDIDLFLFFLFFLHTSFTTFLFLMPYFFFCFLFCTFFITAPLKGPPSARCRRYYTRSSASCCSPWRSKT
jgi:hypothetical protein